MKINLGFSSEDELLDLIERWHEEQPACKLHEFLGVLEEDYKKWVTESSDGVKYSLLRMKTK